MTTQLKTLAHVLVGVAIAVAAAIIRPQLVDMVLQSPLLGEASLPRYADGSEKLNRIPEPANLVELFPDIVVRDWLPAGRYVALTFDDGPDDVYTPKILDILARYGARATFFLIGASVEKHPEAVKRMVAEGHAIGNHTYFHSNLSRMAPWQVLLDLEKAEAALRRVAGYSPALVRPPYGALDPVAVEAIGKKGYRVFLWTVDSLDWRGLDAAAVAENVLPKLKSGAIILQHSAGGPDEDLTGTLEALPVMIEALKSQGYAFLTAPEIIKEVDAARRAGGTTAPGATAAAPGAADRKQ